MHKEIFETADFSNYANEHLVLVNADFPRQKKNQLTKELQQQNDMLAEKYNPKGSFPLTVLLTVNCKLHTEIANAGAIGFIKSTIRFELQLHESFIIAPQLQLL